MALVESCDKYSALPHRPQKVINLVVTSMQNCCKGDSPCQWNTPTLDPHRKPLNRPTINLTGDYVGDLTQRINFGISTLKGTVLHMYETVIMRVYFFTAYYFLSPYPPVYRDVVHYFFAKKRQFLYIPNVNTSIGNNSGF